MAKVKAREAKRIKGTVIYEILESAKCFLEILLANNSLSSKKCCKNWW